MPKLRRARTTLKPALRGYWGVARWVMNMSSR